MPPLVLHCLNCGATFTLGYMGGGTTLLIAASVTSCPNCGASVPTLALSSVPEVNRCAQLHRWSRNVLCLSSRSINHTEEPRGPRSAVGEVELPQRRTE